MRRLRTSCEAAKRELSSTTSTHVDLYSLSNGIDFSMNISRARFEELNSSDFKKTLQPVQAALDDANISKADVDVILLVGGSTRIPKVQKILKDFFENKPIEKTINPDEAVAYGAAVYAAMLKGNWSSKVFGKVLQDITPLSLGLILRASGVLTAIIVIPRNMPIPVVRYKNSRTLADNQESALFEIVQGESPVPEQNYKLGEYCIDGLPPGPAGSINFTTAFEIDANGILSVKSVEESSCKSNGIVISDVSGHLRKELVDQMIKDAETYRFDQLNRKQAIQAKDLLEKECYSIKNDLSANEDVIKTFEKEKIIAKCDETLIWLEENPREGAFSYERRHEEVKSFSRKILDKIRGIFSTD